jgi:PIN domain nuclease of toxin-antitoxin system
MIILDTHALVWLVNRDPRMGEAARDLADIALTEWRLWVSAITFCEIAYLVRQAKLRLGASTVEWRRDLMSRGLRERTIDGTVAIEAVLLAGFHKDPADRLIVATALRMGAGLLTADENILAWGGPLERYDARR